MTIQAKLICQRVAESLSDTTSITWTIDRLVRYLNDGQRAIAEQRPDAFNTTAVLNLVQGHSQQIPSTGNKLIAVHANASGAKRAVTKVDRGLLDRQIPNWRSITPAAEIVHFCFDPRDPKRFDVYPPASVAASLEVSYSAAPIDIAEPTPGNTYASVSGNIGVGDLFANALQEYMLYRCHAENNEAAQAARAAAHFGAFAAMLGVEVNATLMVAPGGKPIAQAAPAQEA